MGDHGLNPCAACSEKRIHTPAEWIEFHPYAGHGYSEGLGWSHPDLEALDDNASAQ
jgi:hypothetical protein